MSAELSELQKERAALAERMNAITTNAAEGRRSFTDSEEAEFNKADAEQGKLKVLIDRLEKTASINSDLRAVRPIGPGMETKIVSPIVTGNPEELQMKAWRSYLLNGDKNLDSAQAASLRALDVATGSAGGYLAPAQAQNQIIQYLKDATSVLAAPVTYYPTVSGVDLPFPVVDDTANSGEKSPAPAVAIGDSTDPTFSTTTLKSYAYDSKIVRVSRMLLQDSVVPAEQLINKLLAERVAQKVNNALTVGTGSSQPQGIVTGSSASGVTLPASTLGASGAAVYSNLQALVHSVPPQYRKSNRFGFMFNDSTLLVLKQQVDSQNRPLWVAGMQSGEPDRICGIPYYTNPDMSAIGTGNKSIVVGDLSQFYVRQVQQVDFIRLDQPYAATLEIGFLVWVRVDGRVMNSNALKYGVHS